jgi:hypothetical protein
VASEQAAPARIELHHGWILQSSRKVTQGGHGASKVFVPQVADGEFEAPYFGMNIQKNRGASYPGRCEAG